MVLVLSLSKPAAQQQAKPMELSVSGTLACLPHKNAGTGQPQTLECAIGLRTDDGRYYSLQGLSSQDSQTSFNTRVYISGNSTPPSADTTYDTVGDIQVSRFSTSTH
jgi:hypothetical protein